MNETLQGWINLYKPKNISSFFAIKKIQSKFQIKKIGHCGTLDPMAEGILPIAIGKTTKLIPFVIKKEKKYIFNNYTFHFYYWINSAYNYSIHARSKNLRRLYSKKFKRYKQFFSN